MVELEDVDELEVLVLVLVDVDVLVDELVDVEVEVDVLVDVDVLVLVDVVVVVATASLISTAIPPSSLATAPFEKSTEVSFVVLYSVRTVWFPSASKKLVSSVKPLPAAVVSVATPPVANDPYVPLSVSPKAARVTVNEVAVAEPSAFVADCTIAPEPFVPLVSAPVTSSTTQEMPVCV